jgi:hypothetical protein
MQLLPQTCAQLTSALASYDCALLQPAPRALRPARSRRRHSPLTQPGSWNKAGCRTLSVGADCRRRPVTEPRSSGRSATRRPVPAPLPAVHSCRLQPPLLGRPCAAAPQPQRFAPSAHPLAALAPGARMRQYPQPRPRCAACQLLQRRLDVAARELPEGTPSLLRGLRMPQGRCRESTPARDRSLDKSHERTPGQIR